MLASGRDAQNEREGAGLRTTGLGLIQKHILRDTELAAKKGFQKSTRLEKGAVFSAIESECMVERYGAPTSSRSSSANDALTALAAADLSSRGSSPLPRRRRPPTSPPLQENSMRRSGREVRSHTTFRSARARHLRDSN